MSASATNASLCQTIFTVLRIESLLTTSRMRAPLWQNVYSLLVTCYFEQISRMVASIDENTSSSPTHAAINCFESSAASKVKKQRISK